SQASPDPRVSMMYSISVWPSKCSNRMPALAVTSAKLTCRPAGSLSSVLACDAGYTGGTSAGDEELVGMEATLSVERGEEHDRTAAAAAAATTRKAGTYRIGVRDMNAAFRSQPGRAQGSFTSSSSSRAAGRRQAESRGTCCLPVVEQLDNKQDQRDI